MTRRLALAFIAAAAVSGRSADPLPADLALVPADAVGFVHVRARDFWASDLMASLRTTVEKAGPKAVTACLRGYNPPPGQHVRQIVSSGAGRRAIFAEPASAELLPLC